MRALLTALVRLWRILPFRRFTHCRYVPSCSEYALEALAEWGALRGTALAVRRVLRCQPFAGSGWDPVPKRTMENAK